MTQRQVRSERDQMRMPSLPQLTRYLLELVMCSYYM